MSKVEEIVAIVEKESPGLLDGISREDGITKEGLVCKILALSRGQMVRTHQNSEKRTSPQGRRKLEEADGNKGDDLCGEHSELAPDATNHLYHAGW